MTPEQILSEEVFTIHARPKTGAEHIAALAEAGYRIVQVAALKQERTDDAGVTVHVTQIEKEP